MQDKKNARICEQLDGINSDSELARESNVKESNEQTIESNGGNDVT